MNIIVTMIHFWPCAVFPFLCMFVRNLPLGYHVRIMEHDGPTDLFN